MQEVDMPIVRAIQEFPALQRHQQHTNRFIAVAVDGALKYTRQAYRDGQLRCNLITWKYWNGIKNPALDKISVTTSNEWERDFFREVAKRLNLESCTGCIYWRRVNHEGTRNACFFCFDTGHLRKSDGVRCFSKQYEEPKTEKEAQKPKKKEPKQEKEKRKAKKKED